MTSRRESSLVEGTGVVGISVGIIVPEMFRVEVEDIWGGPKPRDFKKKSDALKRW